MNVATTQRENNAAPAPPLSSTAERLVSVDVFRGLNMLVMMFSNFLSDRNLWVADLPAWMRHAHKPDTMTYPDVIWPAFTFMLGFSVPLAVEKRLAAGQRKGAVWRHVLVRSLALMGMGCLMGNAWGAINSGHPIGMSMALWNALLIVSFLLIWRRHPGNSQAARHIDKIVRVVGAVLLLGLVLGFRDGPDSHGLRPGWWILGALGWAYLLSASIYMAFRRRSEAIMGCLGLCLLMYVGDRSGAFDKLAWLQPLRQVIGFGSLLGIHPAMALVGVVVGLLFIPGSAVCQPWLRVRWIVGFAAGLFFAGFLLRPLYGCWKGAETPTWALYSTGISCLIFAGLYALVDIGHFKRWATPLIPVGGNALLAYLLADLAYPTLLLLGVDASASGWVGIGRTIVLVLGLTLLTSWLTVKGILQLKL